MLCGRSYQPRAFDQALLHRCVTQHWPRVRLACETHDRPLPPFVKREFESYLRCGDLREGFLRIHCAGCGHDRLVPFSCKGRGFCPSCGGRRMEEGAAWLCERILPPVPLRQWVLSLPKVLRYLLAYDGKLCRAVAKVAMQEVFRYQRLRARRALGLISTRQAHTGAMVAVQRFGSALNLNIHFHALVLDGVFVVDAFGHPTFMELAPPSLGDLHRVAARIAEAVLALLRRRRIWLDELAEEEDPVVQRSESLAGMAKASISGTLVFGTIRRRWVPWAQLLLKVFEVDVMVCPKCDGRMQRIAVIQQPGVIAAILECLSRKEQPP